MDQKKDLHAGRKPRGVSTGGTVKELCNKFPNSKQDDGQTGALSTRIGQEYCNRATARPQARTPAYARVRKDHPAIELYTAPSPPLAGALPPLPAARMVRAEVVGLS